MHSKIIACERSVKDLQINAGLQTFQAGGRTACRSGSPNRQSQHRDSYAIKSSGKAAALYCLMHCFGEIDFFIPVATHHQDKRDTYQEHHAEVKEYIHV